MTCFDDISCFYVLFALSFGEKPVSKTRVDSYSHSMSQRLELDMVNSDSPCWFLYQNETLSLKFRIFFFPTDRSVGLGLLKSTTLVQPEIIGLFVVFPPIYLAHFI
jgi:hypothetical protein